MYQHWLQCKNGFVLSLQHQAKLHMLKFSHNTLLNQIDMV